MSTGAHTRCAANAPAHDAGDVRPSRAARRKARRERCGALVAAGEHVPGGHRSHYTTSDIRDVVQTDLEAMRQQIEAHRKVPMDPQWHYDDEIRRAEHDMQKEMQRV